MGVVCSDTVKMRFLCVGVFFCLAAAAYALPQEPMVNPVEPQGEVTLQETSPVHPPELEDVEAISSREAGEGRKDNMKDKKKGGKDKKEKKEKKDNKKRGGNKRNNKRSNKGKKDNRKRNKTNKKSNKKNKKN